MTDGGRYLHGRPAAADGERHHESTKNLRRCSEERAPTNAPRAGSSWRQRRRGALRQLPTVRPVSGGRAEAPRPLGLPRRT